MAWVFDASITMAWCFEDEQTPQTDGLLDRLGLEGAIVPQLWHLEVANVLTLALRKRPVARITAAQRAQFVGMLTGADIRVDGLTDRQAWGATMELADKYGLSAYDAAYLELAMRLGAELATLDIALRKAAKAAGVVVVP